MLDQLLSIITDDYEFCMDLSMKGTIVGIDTHTPSDQELSTCLHIILTSDNPWNPYKVKFPQSKLTLHDIVLDERLVSAVSTKPRASFQEDEGGEEPLFSLTSMHRRICSMSIIPEVSLVRDERIDTGATDVTLPSTFQSSERHSNVTAQDLSDCWGIGLGAATKTLAKTTQRFLRSAILPLSRRYRTDRMFQRKALAGSWSTDTMDGQSKSLEGNRFVQVFTNKAYFSRIYPMNSKQKAGDALRLFCQEFGVPERLVFDDSKEQMAKGTDFMRQVRLHDIG